jgi:hypothetical protein
MQGVVTDINSIMFVLKKVKAPPRVSTTVQNKIEKIKLRFWLSAFIRLSPATKSVVRYRVNSASSTPHNRHSSNMDDSNNLPEVIKKVQSALEPYIKQRHEVDQIRRILAVHFSSHVNPNERQISRPLALIEATHSGEQTSSGIKGVHKEYLRCIRANIKARKEYARISKEHQVKTEDQQHSRTGVITSSKSQNDSAISLNLFLDLIKKRRKHDRLRIVQDYFDMLAQKPASTIDHFDPKTIFKGVESVPQLPSEVMNVSGPTFNSEGTALNELLDRLEKSVLRAKQLLRKEQTLLAKAKVDSQSPNKTSTTGPGGRLQALGTTRNELINWIEVGLAEAGDLPPEPYSGQGFARLDERGNDYIDAQFALIRRQYAQYSKARQALLLTTTGKLDAPVSIVADDSTDTTTEKSQPENSNLTSHIMHPFLEEIVSVSNEQKSMIQQKSYLTISLAKQLKEASQGLDRLADESHLLPAYPMPAAISQQKGLDGPVSFGDEIPNHEKPDSSHRARAWVFASGVASSATKDLISEKLEEGEMSVLEARKTLLDLQRLLGEDVGLDGWAQKHGTTKNGRPERSDDIWVTLDGHLGVIT